MSATGRGTIRRPDDAYYTPAWLTRAILPYVIRNDECKVLEPAAGDGAIARVIAEMYPKVHVDCMDLVTGTDFLKVEPEPIYSLILSNPPYSLAEEFCKRAMLWRENDRSIVCMLLRLNFLASMRRSGWLRGSTPSIYVSPKRPSFTGHGTDATDYGFFVWDGRQPTVRILDIE